MADYSIGEVERLTGIKIHVLRYWEEAIPLIRPRKDGQGRRFYSSRDVELLSRIKYLVQERKYTLEGAGERLLAELTDPGFLRARESLESLRAELMGLYAIAQEWKKRGSTAP
jgi:DNA-binding transcriptional MerR regulator